MAYPYYQSGAGYPAYGQQPAYPQYNQGGSAYGNGYGYQGAPPPRPIPPPVANPQEAFRSFYQQQLCALTSSARPIIQNLTILAQERRDRSDWASCDSVAMEIELAMDKAYPTAKLALLHLIDSISKNVGAPYTSTFFPKMLAPAFLRAYAAVDGVTKTKMEETLGTWRTGGPGGTELFANGVREEIERGIYGGQQYHAPQFPGYGEPLLTQEAVLDQLARALQAKRHILARDPRNTEAQLHSGVLEQIQRLLHTQALALPDLQSIAQQLATINAAETSSAIGSGTPVSYPSAPTPPIRHQALQNNPPPPLRPQDRLHNGSSGSHTPQGYPHLPIPTHVAPPPVAPVVPPNIDFGSLFKNLAAAGVISQSSTPNAYAGTPLSRGGGTPDGRSAREGSIGSERSDVHGGQMAAQAEAEVDEEDGLAEYEDLILAMNVTLTMVDLETPRDFDPTAHLPNRCSQCSARFPAGKLGRSRLQAHLDWHFRRNRRERESEGRGGHRRWLPKAEFWINDILASSIRDDLIEAGNAVASGSGAQSQANRAETSAADKAQRTEELKSQWVVVPADPAKAAIPCPICKEKFASEYSESEEEWIWTNATRVDNQIYHATCRADAISSAIASRKLAEAGKNASRAISPAGRNRAGIPGGGGGASTNDNAGLAPSLLKPRPEAAKDQSSLAEHVVQVKQEERESIQDVGDGPDSSSAATLTDSLKRKAADEVDIDKVVKKEK